MNDLRNYWLARLELKREIVKVIKQNFVPPIYKQLTAKAPQKPKKP